LLGLIWAEYGGGAAYYQANGSCRHNTFFKNAAQVAGGGVWWLGGDDLDLANCILWENPSPDGAQVRHEGGGALTVTHCDVQNGAGNPWFDSSTCISLPPSWEVDSGDPAQAKFLRLRNDSPCINMGSWDYYTLKDMDGKPHNYAGSPDMGASEYVTAADIRFKSSLADADHAISIAATNPSPVSLNLIAGSANKYREYYVLGSVTGNAPGLNLPLSGKTLLCNMDPFTSLLMNSYLVPSPVFKNFSGKLSLAGKATAELHYGGMLTPELEGLVLSFAWTLRNPGAPWDTVSNPLNIRIKP